VGVETGLLLLSYSNYFFIIAGQSEVSFYISVSIIMKARPSVKTKRVSIISVAILQKLC